MIFEHSEVLIMQAKTDICENAALNGIGEAFKIAEQGWEGREGEWPQKLYQYDQIKQVLGIILF